MVTFILIHGAWHGGWCWERILPLLTAQGHRVLAPDLPGMGRDTTPLSSITLEDWTQFVTALVLKQDEKVILVGHSRGGIIISQVAEYAATQIKTLVYLAAFLIPNGKTLGGTVMEHPRVSNRLRGLALSVDQPTSTLPLAVVRDTFYNTTPEIWLQRAVSLMGPEPMANFWTPVFLSEAAFGKIPRVYIECLQDRAIPIAFQRRMRSALPCEQVLTLDTDHSPFYSAPALLAASLLSLTTTLEVF